MRACCEKEGHSSCWCFLELSGKGPITDAVFGGPVTLCLCACIKRVLQVLCVLPSALVLPSTLCTSKCLISFTCVQQVHYMLYVHCLCKCDPSNCKRQSFGFNLLIWTHIRQVARPSTLRVCFEPYKPANMIEMKFSKLMSWKVSSLYVETNQHTANEMQHRISTVTDNRSHHSIEIAKKLFVGRIYKSSKHSIDPQTGVANNTLIQLVTICVRSNLGQTTSTGFYVLVVGVKLLQIWTTMATKGNNCSGIRLVPAESLPATTSSRGSDVINRSHRSMLRSHWFASNLSWGWWRRLCTSSWWARRAYSGRCRRKWAETGGRPKPDSAAGARASPTTTRRRLLVFGSRNRFWWTNRQSKNRFWWTLRQESVLMTKPTVRIGSDEHIDRNRFWWSALRTGSDKHIDIEKSCCWRFL